MLTPHAIAKNLFDEFFDSAIAGYNAYSIMKTDIKENDADYELVIDLPDVRKEDMRVELKDSYLTISATIGQFSNDGNAQTAKYLRRERFTGSFYRSFYVGNHVKQEDIRAKLENGTLHLYIPKQSRTPQVESKNLIAIEG